MPQAPRHCFRGWLLAAGIMASWHGMAQEESGYRGFYHHLLRPGTHYLPFWRERPEEVRQDRTWRPLGRVGKEGCRRRRQHWLQAAR